MKNISHDEVYNLLSQIPLGKITTYKEIAKKLNSKSYRRIGQIIAKNPNIPAIPCHRVIKSDSSISGYALGVEKKISILQQEGIKIVDNKVINFEQKFYHFE
jgi:methylated-DNA-[protein]-cysteine S-methyltransferase